MKRFGKSHVAEEIVVRAVLVVLGAHHVDSEFQGVLAREPAQPVLQLLAVGSVALSRPGELRQPRNAVAESDVQNAVDVRQVGRQAHQAQGLHDVQPVLGRALAEIEVDGIVVQAHPVAELVQQRWPERVGTRTPWRRDRRAVASAARPSASFLPMAGCRAATMYSARTPGPRPRTGGRCGWSNRWRGHTPGSSARGSSACAACSGRRSSAAARTCPGSAWRPGLIRLSGMTLFGKGASLLNGSVTTVGDVARFPVLHAAGATVGVRFCCVALPREVSYE